LPERLSDKVQIQSRLENSDAFGLGRQTQRANRSVTIRPAINSFNQANCARVSRIIGRLSTGGAVSSFSVGGPEVLDHVNNRYTGGPGTFRERPGVLSSTCSRMPIQRQYAVRR
jgi:hypothetical protein